MRYSIIVAAIALSAFALIACDRQAAVAPSPPPVIVNVPGPAGPQGAQGVQGTPGAPAEKGATGEQGKEGKQGKEGQQGGDTIVLVPAPAPQR